MLPSAHGGHLVDRVLRDAQKDEALEEAKKLPQVELSLEQASDTVNIAIGLFSPLEGFLGSAALESVLQEMRLPSGVPWTIPILLDVGTEELSGVKDRLALTYEGAPLAIIDLEEVYTFDLERLAREVFGTSDLEHPGVARTLAFKSNLVAGKVRLVKQMAQPFSKHYLGPADTRALFQDKGWATVVGFQTRNVPHLGHEYLQKTALTLVDGLFVNPVIGKKKAGDFKDEVIIRTYETLLENYFPSARVTMAILPTEMRYAGPREAIFHAIVRKNYGCTHFIVGRDHAGVGSYYAPNAAQDIFQHFPDLGITPILFPAFFYCRRCEGATNDKVCPHGKSEQMEFSGTFLRSILTSKGSPDSRLIRPEVARVMRSYANPFVEGE